MTTTERMLGDSSVFVIAKEGLDNSLERKISQKRTLSNGKFAVVITENSLLGEHDKFETLRNKGSDFTKLHMKFVFSVPLQTKRPGLSKKNQ